MDGQAVRNGAAGTPMICPNEWSLITPSRGGPLGAAGGCRRRCVAATSGHLAAVSAASRASTAMRRSVQKRRWAQVAPPPPHRGLPTGHLISWALRISPGLSGHRHQRQFGATACGNPSMTASRCSTLPGRKRYPGRLDTAADRRRPKGSARPGFPGGRRRVVRGRREGVPSSRRGTWHRLAGRAGRHRLCSQPPCPGLLEARLAGLRRPGPRRQTRWGWSGLPAHRP